VFPQTAHRITQKLERASSDAIAPEENRLISLLQKVRNGRIKVPTKFCSILILECDTKEALVMSIAAQDNIG